VALSERFFGTEPKFLSGAPKQFAVIVGTVFAGLGCLFLFLAKEHGEGLLWLGVAFLICLAGAAGLNGLIDFCLGCVFFKLGIEYKVFPKTVYTRTINEKQDTKWTYADLHKRGASQEIIHGTKCAHTCGVSCIEQQLLQSCRCQKQTKLDAHKAGV
jgi:hypothetical protein